MSDNIIDSVESMVLSGKKEKNNRFIFNVFGTKGSQGSNPEKLSQILATFDFIVNILGWQDRPLANFSHILTQYQASIDGKYHRDAKEISIAEEIERRKETSRNQSIIQR